MKIFTTTILCMLSFYLLAQDTYHMELNEVLMSNYGLPEANWLITDTEVDNYNLIGNYGCSESIQNISDQSFTLASQVEISQQGNSPWDSGWNLSNTSNVQNGDKLLLILWLRSIGGDGTANIFVERTLTFEKEVYITADITEEWTPYSIPFEATFGNYNIGQMSMGFHLANQAQTLQIGGFTVINYGDAVSISDLPSNINNDQYEGYEDDAAWRALAADRIDQYRKANLTINAENSTGDPVPDAAFHIEMTQHDFAFGSAITAARIAGNNSQNVSYENKIANLDDNGHGFNWVVFENDLKWDGWEEQWFVNHAELVNAVSWLADRDIKVRGHNLVWPAFQYMPDDIQANAGDFDYIWNRIDGRLDEILNYPGLEADKVPEWDVLNELVFNTSLEATFQNAPGNTTGREVYADIFERAKQLSPDTKMYINDYVTMTLNNTGGGAYDILKDRIQELLDAGAPVEGIGFQAHIGGSPNGIPSILGTLDDFYNEFGLTAKITEFDMPPIVSEELGANYLRDFLTAVFSHESVDGFLFWNFWDGATWQNPGTNLFRLDWSRTPAGDMFVDLVFNEWWTDIQKTTNTNGTIQNRSFKGKYNITYVCNDQTITETIDLTEDQTLNIVCDNLGTGIFDINPIQEISFSVSPNPASQYLRIEKEDIKNANLILYNSLGTKVLELEVSNRIFEIPVAHLQGIYFLELSNESGRGYQRVVIN